MNIGKGKLIAVSSLAALGGVAAIALATQPETSSSEPAAAAAPVHPKIRTHVVHRVEHVQAKPGSAPSSSAAPAPAPVEVSAPPPVSAPAPVPASAPAPVSEAPSESYEDEGDDSYESESADEADHESEDVGEDVNDD